ncbi:MAG: hypothetical protein U1E73_03105 [Planctomycetota bacterium]
MDLVVRQGHLMREVAAKFRITPTRVCQIVREALGLRPKRIPKSAAVKPLKLKAPSPTPQRALTRAQIGARNRLIVRLARECVSHVRIGVRFGISKQRVHQILGQVAARAHRRKAVATSND